MKEKSDHFISAQQKNIFLWRLIHSLFKNVNKIIEKNFLVDRNYL
jgi:hypothetical protein